MIEVLFPRERDIGAWTAGHARGERPGLWPYGLDELRALDPDACVGSLPATTKLDAVRTRLLGRILPEPRPKDGGAPVGITWDENSARRMLMTKPHQRMYSGVIWITDIAARSGETGSMRELLRRLDGLWVISRGQVDSLRDFVGEDGPPIRYFRFGVDADFYAARPYPERPLVLSVGGDRDRDPATLFAALEQVRAEVPDAEIVVQTTSDLTPPEGVTTVRHVPHTELRDLYARASVVVVATRDNQHASGMTVSLEAQATGRPVVMTRTAGIEDYVDHERTGLLVPVGDGAALAQGVTRLLQDPGLAAAYGRAGRAAVEEGMTTGHMVRSLASFIGVADPALEASER